jgi:D-3-phosphoglycerate dehydrogenase / 2-oxoglutarate reductase
MKVLVVGALDPAGLARLRGAGHEVVEHAGLEGGALAAALRDAHALVVTGRTRVTEEVLRGARALRIVVRVGTGLESVDIPAARERGVRVADTPGAAAVSRAEHVFALLLALERHLVRAGADARQGGGERDRLVGRELYGRALGLVGFGRVGREVAWRARALGMDVRWTDPLLELAPAGYEWADRATLQELLPWAGVLSLHLPLTRATRGLVGARELARLVPDAVLVSVSPPGVVDERALAAALAEGRLRGAALDGLAAEPAAGSPLLALPNVVLTPRLGGATVEAGRRAGLEAAALVIEALGRAG